MLNVKLNFYCCDDSVSFCKSMQSHMYNSITESERYIKTHDSERLMIVSCKAKKKQKQTYATNESYLQVAPL